MGYSAGVVTDYSGRVRDFLKWLETKAIRHLRRITQKHITTYFEYLQSRPNKRRKGHLLSVSHLNHNFHAVDKLLEFLSVQGMKNTPPPTNFRLPVDKEERIRKIEILQHDEIETLLGAIEHTYPTVNFIHREQNHYQFKLIFALAYGCGLRLSECMKIRFQDIDFERKTVFVEKGKNYKDRFVPMSPGTYSKLQNYIYNFRNKYKLPHDRLFLTSNKNTPNKMLKHLQNVCDDEAIQSKRLSMHVLRHSIATNLLQKGMNIENISQFLGHSSLGSTQIYTHLLE